MELNPPTAQNRQASHQAMRRCLASSVVRPKDELLRFVVGPDGEIVPDLAAELPGRGLWVTPERDLLERACAKNLFARAAKAPVRVPPDLPDRVEGLWLKWCMADLSLAKRSGQLTSGFEKVRAWLSQRQVGVLCQAVDGAEDGRVKLRRLALAANPRCRVVEVLASDEMGRALGAEPRVHVAIQAGPLADRLVRDAARLVDLRPKGHGVADQTTDQISKAQRRAGAG